MEETCWSGDLRRRWEFGGDIFLKIPTRSFVDAFCDNESVMERYLGGI